MKKLLVVILLFVLSACQSDKCLDKENVKIIDWELNDNVLIAELEDGRFVEIDKDTLCMVEIDSQ